MEAHWWGVYGFVCVWVGGGVGVTTESGSVFIIMNDGMHFIVCSSKGGRDLQSPPEQLRPAHHAPGHVGARSLACSATGGPPGEPAAVTAAWRCTCFVCVRVCGLIVNVCESVWASRIVYAGSGRVHACADKRDVTCNMKRHRLHVHMCVCTSAPVWMNWMFFAVMRRVAFFPFPPWDEERGFVRTLDLIENGQGSHALHAQAWIPV